MRFVGIFFIFLLILTGFVFFNKQPGYQISRGEMLVNSILAKSAGIIKTNYDMRPCGMGAAMPGGPIKSLTLCFDTKYPLSKEQLREVLIKSAHELLNQVHVNEEIQTFIKNLPFTIKNVTIIIYNKNKDGSDVFDPQICIARISSGSLTYRTTDKKDTLRFNNRFEESYEEALKLIQLKEK